ncbi:MAG TPA: glycosyltransferase, partial [Hyphomicrobiaceae bacterium]|nr:glycosyltransferase [Hyphomicrobiaceae bacterium]
GETGQKLTNWAVAPQIKLAARRAGIRRPLVWVHCPAGAALPRQLNPVATVLQRTDRFEAFPEADYSLVGAQIAQMKADADLVVYAAPHLAREERGQVRKSLLLTHGVDLDMFGAAGRQARNGSVPMPADVAEIAAHRPGPLVGFTGGIDRHTFDPAMFIEVARQRSDCQFIMIGACSLPDGWCELPNVHFLGRKPYDEIATYMAAMDVLIMPWNTSEWIKACNPIKLKEYLATGRPIVTSDFQALDGWRDIVRVATGAEAFAEAIADAVREGEGYGARRKCILERLAAETWDAKADLLAQELVGLVAKDRAQFFDRELAAA